MIPKTVAFHHFGCKVNFAETSALSRQFKDLGYRVCEFREKADVYVISTCVVTAVAEKKCRAAIHQAHRLNPDAKIAVIGCFSELKPAEVAKVEGVNLVLGHMDKFDLLEQLEHIEDPPQEKVIADEKAAAGKFIPSYSYGDRTRSFLKIQDGCDYYCAYCTIPLARGHSRSDTIENVLREVKEIASSGVREIVLTGVNIGDFGRHGNETLFGLLKEIDRIGEMPRIRLSSIEPDLLSDDIIRLVAGSNRFMPHFQIPLQSGTDRILRLMKRKYNTALYRSRVNSIREKLPLACIAADVIVGFPGETEHDFSETFDFLAGLDISYMHVFSYSARENTLSSGMTGVVAEIEKKKRSSILHLLSDSKKKKFYDLNAGTDASVLFESDNTGGFMHGFTENYIKVKTPYDPSRINKICRVALDERDNNGIFIANEIL
jgi:threonylcarbamoyladenosine tRNA methylthiotransferase MtaB